MGYKSHLKDFEEKKGKYSVRISLFLFLSFFPFDFCLLLFFCVISIKVKNMSRKERKRKKNEKKWGKYLKGLEKTNSIHFACFNRVFFLNSFHSSFLISNWILSCYSPTLPISLCLSSFLYLKESTFQTQLCELWLNMNVNFLSFLISNWILSCYSPSLPLTHSLWIIKHIFASQPRK